MPVQGGADAGTRCATRHDERRHRGPVRSSAPAAAAAPERHRRRIAPRPGGRRGPGRLRPALEPVRRGNSGAAGAGAEPAAGLSAGAGTGRRGRRDAMGGSARSATAPQPQPLIRSRPPARRRSGSAPPPACSVSRRPPRTGPAPSRACTGDGGTAGADAGRRSG